MALHRVSIDGLVPVAGDVGPEPVLEFVAIADLVIDDAYQRSIEKRGLANIQKIAANFDWAKFSPLMVSRRSDGRCAIIDGQHRAHAAALRGIERVPALVSQLHPEQEASAFAWINGNVTALTGNQIYKAALAAFEPWAVQCNAVVESAGCRLMTFQASAAQKRPGQVYAIGAIRNFVEAGHARYLAAVLAGVRQSSVSDNVAYYNAYGLRALVPAAVACGVTEARVIEAFLDAHNLEDTAQRVHRIREQPGFAGKSFKSLFADSVVTLMRAFSQSDAVSMAAAE